MATLLFLGASVSQLPAIRYAREAGHRVVAVDGDPTAVAFPLAHVAYSIDFTDVARVAEAGAANRVDGVLAVSSDRAVLPAAAVAELLDLPGIGVDVARSMTDKVTMRARLAGAGVPQPNHVAVTEAADLGAAAAARLLPAVLKPADSGGQRGLHLVSSCDEAERLLPDVLRFSRSGTAMLEEYVDGVELNGILVVRDGEPYLVTLSDRLRPGGIGFGVGWIHSYPSSLPPQVLGRARGVAFAAVQALGLQNGIAFPQLIADSSGTVRLIEIAARIAAGQMADLVRFGTGINLFEIAIAQALGQAVPDGLVTPAFRRPIAIRFLTASPGILPLGTVAQVAGLDDVRTSPGVLAAGLYFGPGATIGPLQVDADRRGYVVTTAETPTKALELADAAAANLVVRTREGDERQVPRARRWRRAARLLPAATALALVFGTVLALVFSENAKLQRALILGTRVDKVFSPTCGCSHDVAHLTFRVMRRGRLTVQIVNTVGRPVATFVRDHVVQTGRERFLWNGRDALGRVLPTGAYLLQVTFPSLHRTLRLPSPIELDTGRPRLLRMTVLARERRVRVGYSFSEPAHALLLVDGRRAVLTRSTAATGSLSWFDEFRNGRRLGPGSHRLALVAIDLAGNRSRRSRPHRFRVAAPRD